jgi:hypothetical protein
MAEAEAVAAEAGCGIPSTANLLEQVALSLAQDQKKLINKRVPADDRGIDLKKLPLSQLLKCFGGS